MLIRLTTPDQRICGQCHGMGWYYVETPESNRPLNAVLKQCQRPHAEMEPKQLDLSKVLQGATEAVINRHRDVVSRALRERDERKKREQAPTFWVQTGEPVASDETK